MTPPGDGGPELDTCPWCGGPIRYDYNRRLDALDTDPIEPSNVWLGCCNEECPVQPMTAGYETTEEADEAWATRRPATRDAALREEGRVQGLEEAKRAVASVPVFGRPTKWGEGYNMGVSDSHGAVARALAAAPTPDASQGSAPVCACGGVGAQPLTGPGAWRCQRCFAALSPPAAPQDAPGRLEPHDWISQHAPGVEQRTFCSRCGADLADEEADRWCKPTRAARGETPTTVAAPQGSPLPWSGPRIDEVVEVFTEGQWRPAKVNAVYPDAFGWTVLPAGLPDGGSIGGATSVSNAAWRRNPPEGGALEGEMAEALRSLVFNNRCSRLLCDEHCRCDIGRGKRALARYDASKATPQRTWQEEREAAVAYLRRRVERWRPEATANGERFGQLVNGLAFESDEIEAGKHIQHPAPAIPQSGDEKEGTGGK